MVTWSELAALTRLITRSSPEGVNKASSGMLSVVYGNENMFTDNTEHIIVEVNGYDISNWSRHEYFGPFKTEEEAKLHLLDKLIMALEELNVDRNEADLPEIDLPNIEPQNIGKGTPHVFEVCEITKDRGPSHGFFSTFDTAKSYVDACYTTAYERFMMIRLCRINTEWPTSDCRNSVLNLWIFKQEDGTFVPMS